MIPFFDFMHSIPFDVIVHALHLRMQHLNHLDFRDIHNYLCTDNLYPLVLQINCQQY